MIFPELLRGIFAGYPLEDWAIVGQHKPSQLSLEMLTFLASRMFFLEFGQIISVVINNDPIESNVRMRAEDTRG